MHFYSTRKSTSQNVKIDEHEKSETFLRIRRYSYPYNNNNNNNNMRVYVKWVIHDEGRVTRLGEFSSAGWLLNLGSSSENYRSSPNYVATVNSCTTLDTIRVGLHFGIFFNERIWPPCVVGKTKKQDRIIFSGGNSRQRNEVSSD
jgi:hypothetical protein